VIILLKDLLTDMTMKKNMGKILILLFTASITTIAVAQPCTPMNNFPGNQGILPEALSNAYLDTAYEQIVHFKAPLDTMVLFNNIELNFRVDSLRIVGVIGLPAGITYECLNSSCMINGGEVGCVKMSGQPTEGGVFPLKIAIKISGKITGFIPIPQTSIDTNERYVLYVFPRTGLFSIQDNSMKVYPNPARGFVRIPYEQTHKSILRVFDINGKLIHFSDNMPEYTDYEIQTQEWNKGLYTFELSNGLMLKRTRVLIQ
jgi:hypothetical protein